MAAESIRERDTADRWTQCRSASVARSSHAAGERGPAAGIVARHVGRRKVEPRVLPREPLERRFLLHRVPRRAVRCKLPDHQLWPRRRSVAGALDQRHPYLPPILERPRRVAHHDRCVETARQNAPASHGNVESLRSDGDVDVAGGGAGGDGNQQHHFIQRLVP
eukprot:CAMPEP_0182939812 /NCGR_PEP_ID=MMETSP0105_2-20130417/46254_1 /TAXON_ID=81532 ORGANISM="Acanthoeca-like sp., Strain 10tr" /NCGR_SAMPLE_ID=MMETSP0105_2 /ASSEMBLY_ACC=CAM_ASM_000205 /LENGTH=163 /DNA_ID=CAMNT_0025079253 /DNA_START=137 /DNA_END=625 /DNA_ORIENTATION=-